MDRLQSLQPRMVSYEELYNTLFPYVQGYKWGRDTIYDLWKMGAPVPMDRCPGGKPCKQYPNCEHVRHFLYPSHFEKWWTDVREKISLEISVGEVMSGIGKTH